MVVSRCRAERSHSSFFMQEAAAEKAATFDGLSLSGGGVFVKLTESMNHRLALYAL